MKNQNQRDRILKNAFPIKKSFERSAIYPRQWMPVISKPFFKKPQIQTEYKFNKKNKTYVTKMVLCIKTPKMIQRFTLLIDMNRTTDL